MSAFVVDPYHIRYLNTYASHHQVRTPRRDDRSSCTHDEAATLLFNECVRSVSYRYPNDTYDTLPGRVGFTTPVADNTTWRHLPWDSDNFPAGRVLAALACLEYQSCETPDYRETPAYEYLEAIRHEAIRHTPGYEDVWEITGPFCSCNYDATVAGAMHDRFCAAGSVMA